MPVMDDGNDDGRVEAKLARSHFNALTGAIVDPTWVAQ